MVKPLLSEVSLRFSTLSSQLDDPYLFVFEQNIVRPKAYFPYFEGRSEEHCHDVEIAGNIWANYNAVVITEITPELHFYAQKFDQGPALEQLTLQLRQELNTNPPLAGSYTPKEGKLLLVFNITGIFMSFDDIQFACR